MARGLCETRIQAESYKTHFFEATDKSRLCRVCDQRETLYGIKTKFCM